MDQPRTLTELPPGYHADYHLSVTDPKQLVWLNILALVAIVPFAALSFGWLALAGQVRGGADGSASINLLLVLLTLLVLPLHELVHGVFIRWAGHTPRYGAKYTQLGPLKLPYVLFATTDDGFFWRNQFIVIALAPVVLITLAGLLLMSVLPLWLGYYVAVALVLNGSGAVGDLWMTVVALRYAPDAVVRDEADSITVFKRG
jgi:hypothetical protein